MNRSPFWHEFRTALREARWLVGIPTLVILGGTAIWHRLWLTHSEHPETAGLLSLTQVQAQELLGTIWPWTAWLVPYGILKFPDLKDPFAYWRGTPASRRDVFGARLTLAVVATVLVPAFAYALFMVCVYPEIATEQLGVALLNQWTHLGIGAFAALAAPRHRGLGLLALMALTWLASKQVAADVLTSFSAPWFLKTQKEDPALIFLRYALPLLAPLAIWQLTRAAARPIRFKPWLLGTAALAFIATGGGILYSDSFNASEHTPTLRATLHRLPDKEASVTAGHYQLPYEPNSGAGFYTGRAARPDSAERIMPFTYDTAHRIHWRMGDQSGIKPSLPKSSQTYIHISDTHQRTHDTPVLDRNWWAGQPHNVARLLDAAGTLFPVDNLQIASEKTDPESKETIALWTKIADFKRADPINFMLISGLGTAQNRGQPIPDEIISRSRVTAKVYAYKWDQPKICFRIPALAGGTWRTSAFILKWAPVNPDRIHEWHKGFNVTMSAQLVCRRPPIIPLFGNGATPDFEGEYNAMLYNPVHGQVALLPLDFNWLKTARSNLDGYNIKSAVAHATVRPSLLVIPSAEHQPNSSGEITKWLGESEIVLFSTGNARTTEMPVELNFESPAAPRQ